MKKTCSVCHKEKDIEEFAQDKNRKDGHVCTCKECYNIRSRKNWHKYKEKDNKRKREYHRKHPEQARSRHLHCRYGITLDDYNNIFKEQNGRCAICGRHQMELKNKLYIDHNHVTGAIRGLLCSKCNSVIGLVFEDVNILKEVICYLKNRNAGG